MTTESTIVDYRRRPSRRPGRPPPCARRAFGGRAYCSARIDTGPMTTPAVQGSSQGEAAPSPATFTMIPTSPPIRSTSGPTRRGTDRLAARQVYPTGGEPDQL